MKIKVRALQDIEAEVGTYKFQATVGEIKEYSPNQANIAVRHGWFEEAADEPKKTKADWVADALALGIETKPNATIAQIQSLIEEKQNGI